MKTNRDGKVILVNKYLSIITPQFLLISKLFFNFVTPSVGWLAWSCQLRSPWSGTAFIIEDVCLTSLLTNWNLENFESCSDRDSGGRLPTVYIHKPQVRPFVRRGVPCAAIYIPSWRRHLLLLIFDTIGFSRTSISKGEAYGRHDSYASFLWQLLKPNTI